MFPRVRCVIVAMVALVTLVTGCQVIDLTVTKPAVVISGPANGAEFNIGQNVAITSTSTDPQGITRVELWVDGINIRTDPSPVAQGQAQFQVLESWKAVGAGVHTVTIRAYNTLGAFGEGGITISVLDDTGPGPNGTVSISTPVGIDTPAGLATLEVSETPAPLDTVTAETPIVDTPPAPDTPEAPTDTPVPTGCTTGSAFVTDVTIPDGAVVNPGEPLTKTWRVQNNGTCDWDASFAVMWTGGAQLAAQGAFPVSPTVSGGVVDVSVPLVAPTAPGTYSSIWRLRDSYGNPFGTFLTVQLVVENPPTAVPTRTRTPVPAAPTIPSFTCSPCSITAGQSATLSWGKVNLASSVTIDNGLGGVPTPGSRTVNPTRTTTYVLTAIGPGGTATASVTIVVIAAANFSGAWFHNFGKANLSQNGVNVNGTFNNAFSGSSGSIAGSVSGNTFNGTWTLGGTSGSLQWVLKANGNQFDGNWNGSSKWCGARTGANFPDGCSFDGHWNIGSPSALCPSSAMELTRINMTVTGSYCNGWSVSGAISYNAGQTVLSGSWANPSQHTSGPFVFYLLGYSGLQFRGDYNGTLAWCGWRNGVAQPSPCKQ